MTTIEQNNYDAVKKECDSILINKTGLSWDCLADTNSVWDYISDEPMTDSHITDVAEDACWNRLYDDGMDRDLATELIYGETE